MPVYYPDEARKQALTSLKRYFDEVLDQDIGDLKAELMLDYILREIAPTVYNQAIADAQKLMQERVTDMDSSLFAPEFAYWEKSARRK
ncbi:MAG TPA: DUF2164 domain-containing protein [Gemmatimonadaceae bacterium]|nr:DUF2164 domain-containing protein [Gemmatimonadaceae bacterium]